MMFKLILKEKINDLPAISGVYAFKLKKGVLLYIGKAINIKERVKNHFQQPSFKDNIFIPETEKIGFIATGSEIEALLLEAKLIKKYQPKYNTQWKDGKNYYFVAITAETFPRVFITHQVTLTNNKKQITNNGNRSFVIRPMLFVSVGPFVDGQALKQTLRVLRRVFPFRTCRILPKKPCLYEELNLCPAPCEINTVVRNSCDRTNYGKAEKFKKNYKTNIINLTKVLRGQKILVVKNLRKEMKIVAANQNFEKAKTLRDQIWALENVFQHSHILQKTLEGTLLLPEKELQKLLGIKTKIKRIEGYDISNIQGQEATGSMVVFENGQPNKNEYRKFKIKISGKPNDTAMIQEILKRRLRHREWSLPQVVLIDGGRGQLNIALNVLQEKSGKAQPFTDFMKVAAIAKKNNELFIEGKKTPILLKNLPQETANLILRIRDEAHRFAITYHKKLRSKYLLPK